MKARRCARKAHLRPKCGVFAVARVAHAPMAPSASATAPHTPLCCARRRARRRTGRGQGPAPVTALFGRSRPRSNSPAPRAASQPLNLTSLVSRIAPGHAPDEGKGTEAELEAAEEVAAVALQGRTADTSVGSGIAQYIVHTLQKTTTPARVRVREAGALTRLVSPNVAVGTCPLYAGLAWSRSTSRRACLSGVWRYRCCASFRASGCGATGVVFQGSSDAGHTALPAARDELGAGCGPQVRESQRFRVPHGLRHGARARGTDSHSLLLDLPTRTHARPDAPCTALTPPAHSYPPGAGTQQKPPPEARHHKSSCQACRSGRTARPR